MTEFGGTAPYRLSSYYRLGGRVPDASLNAAIPTSGAIRVTQFHGSVNRPLVYVTLETNQTNYVFNPAKVPGYIAGLTDAVLVINSGVYVSASSTGNRALHIATGWAAGDTVSVINNGFIVGMGGAGGTGAGTTWGSSGVAGTAGSPGGPALLVSVPVSFTNNGTIGGGGGGGGGGGAGSVDASTDRTFSGGGGGGGRSGTTNSAGGSRGTASGVVYNYQGGAGGAGTIDGPGGGGAGGYYTTGYNGGGGAGGSGGAWGAGGASGGGYWGAVNVFTSPATSGGSAGAAISGNSFITWVTTGTRLGAIT